MYGRAGVGNGFVALSLSVILPSIVGFAGILGKLVRDREKDDFQPADVESFESEVISEDDPAPRLTLLSRNTAQPRP